MFAQSQDELELACVGGACLIVTTVYLVWLNHRAEALLRTLRRDESSTVWEMIGAPESIRRAVLDPRERWLELIRSRSYGRLCSPLTASKVDAFRLHANGGPRLLGVAGAIIVWRFWPLLKTSLFGA